MSVTPATAQHDRACTVPHCGNPTVDFVCQPCLKDLQRDLWAIGGHPGHRGGPIAPTSAYDQRLVDEHQGLAAQLVVTMARQDVTGDRQWIGPTTRDEERETVGGRPDEPIAEHALPLDLRASDMLGELRTTLRMWVRVLVDRRGITLTQDPGRDVAELAWWLSRHRQTIGCDPDGGQLVDEVARLVPRAQRVVYPARFEYLGSCPHWHCEVGPDRCEVCAGLEVGDPEHLYVPEGAPFVSCRPCGRSYDVAERRRWLLVQAEDQLVTAEFAADALPRYLSPELGRLLEPRRIRRWAEQGRLTVHRPHPGEALVDGLGRPRLDLARYRVADLLRVVADAAGQAGGRRVVAHGDVG